MNIDQYIASFPKETQQLLKQMRDTIAKAAPNAVETFSYGMPTFALFGNLVHFAAYKQHIGFYPAPSGITAFADELGAYKMSKGAIQFPLDKPLPLALVKKITRFRVKENEQKEAAKNPFSGLSAPAQRALAGKGIKTVKQLSKYSEADIPELHGMGKGSLPKLYEVLETAGLSFKK
ncbi:DUF1801 domain-containing protein [Chitinophaga sedimenti]|uniref:DUF1801 domain-containing protein n=1 Tax=Chitinophaga sedimenti TaxID=2033606 RepID=UPI0020057CB3|nr:DUF1801 domain-containing protein [Chitinophaga sedimenti]MCK7557201.1 DUF1801 domain-containing protein [Chitinophaga sedimenti]